MDDTAVCSACGERLALDQFGPRIGTPTGRRSVCRPCDAAASRSRYRRTAEAHGQVVTPRRSKRRAAALLVPDEWPAELLAEVGEGDPEPAERPQRQPKVTIEPPEPEHRVINPVTGVDRLGLMRITRS